MLTAGKKNALLRTWNGMSCDGPMQLQADFSILGIFCGFDSGTGTMSVQPGVCASARVISFAQSSAHVGAADGMMDRQLSNLFVQAACTTTIAETAVATPLYFSVQAHSTWSTLSADEVAAVLRVPVAALQA